MATKKTKAKTTKARRKKIGVRVSATRPAVDPEVPVNKRDRRKAHVRRAEMRDELWPGSEEEVWSRHGSAGYTTVPRVLPLITVLIRHLVRNEGGDPSSVYFELWSQVYDEGYFQIKNQMDHVYASGYSGARSKRTWEERMRLLEDHGFIRIKPNGAQEYGHVLLINPLLAAARHKVAGSVPDAWWAAFRSRADEIGAEIPELNE